MQFGLMHSMQENSNDTLGAKRSQPAAMPLWYCILQFMPEGPISFFSFHRCPGGICRCLNTSVPLPNQLRNSKPEQQQTKRASNLGAAGHPHPFYHTKQGPAPLLLPTSIHSGLQLTHCEYGSISASSKAHNNAADRSSCNNFPPWDPLRTRIPPRRTSSHPRSTSARAERSRPLSPADVPPRPGATRSVQGRSGSVCARRRGPDRRRGRRAS
mmetsp:Transcript_5015/g.10555  ORF Transcript_5015/g.10555 Transcript_5015/m.10555 type:complete len:213 (+) Transcript_5015:70-708(+)